MPVTSRGTRAPAPRRKGLRPAALRSTIRCNGGYTFAEDPRVAAPDARIIWHADFDPGTLRISARPAERGNIDSVDPLWIDPWLTLVDDVSGQHGVLSDGCHHIRIDVADGRLVGGRPVILHYHLYGLGAAASRILPLRRLLRLFRDRRFPVSLFRAETADRRDIVLLRVNDALREGASLSEIATALFGEESVAANRQRGSDSLRSRVRRLASDARMLASGGYRQLMIRRSGMAAPANDRRDSAQPPR